MDMNTILDRFSQTDWSAAAESVDLQKVTSSPVIMGIVAACIVISLLWCFFGLKLVRIWAAIFGFAIGSAIGMGAATALNLNELYIPIVGLIVGIVLAFMGAILYHMGIFLVVWIAGAGISFAVIRPQELVWILVCAGIGLVLALLTLKFTAPITMVMTGILGAMNSSSFISILLPFQSTWISLVITVVLAVLGIMVQFLLESGKRKKQNLKKAKEIRETHSTENEVEKARAMMENLDKISDEEDEFEIYDEELDDEDEFEIYDEELDDEDEI